MAYLPKAVERADRYKVKVGEYIHYRREGYLKVEELVSLEDVAKLRAWAMEQWEHKTQAAGDVWFFEGHILHRSYPNRTSDRWRRVFVNHYCNARSWVP